MTTWTDHYFLKAAAEEDWTEVSKEDWIRAERAAGFCPKLPSTSPRYMCVCVTAGFHGSVSGKIVSELEG